MEKKRSAPKKECPIQEIKSKVWIVFETLERRKRKVQHSNKKHHLIYTKNVSYALNL